jgi:hypothetical protein
VAGKLGCRDVVSAVRPGRLFYITDSISSRRYLVDTGSAFSIMPWESSDTPCGPNLTTADGRRILCWGERPFTVTIGGVPRRWSFLLAAVSFPIIGIDFLRCHGLLVDVANLRLLPGELPVAAVDLAGEPGPSTAQPRSYAEVVKGAPSPSAGSVFLSGAVPPASSLAAVSPFSPPLQRPPLAPPPASDWAGCLRLRFPAVFSASSAVSRRPPPHGVQHVISMVGQPSTARFCRLDPARLAAAKAEFQSMLDEGVIRRSCSQWSSPLHMVRKKDGSW